MGVSGVAWKVQLYICKTYITEAGTTECLKKCWRKWGARISSNSYGWDVPSSDSWTGPELFKAEIEAAQAGNHLFIGAAANKGVDLDSAKPAWRDYPTMWDLDNMLVVASTDQKDKKRSSSSYGAVSVHLAAPGESILATGLKGSYIAQSGNSAAAPIVAGAAVLMRARARSLGRSLSYMGLKRRLMRTADPVPDYFNKTVSGGRLNIYAALRTIKPKKDKKNTTNV